MIRMLTIAAVLLLGICSVTTAADDGKLRIICFGAHPDDCELQASGVRRKGEVEKAAAILGTTVEVLDNHDGELMPTLENRRTLIRLIREWKADVVLSPRPNDYHPDHRNTALLVADAAYMVTVPFICPDVAPLKRNPVFMYYQDRFQKPYPFHADIVVAIDSVMDKKLDALAIIESPIPGRRGQWR